MSKEQPADIFQPIPDGRFQFSCHRGISCFTHCCAKLRLILTPYDIIRMKKRLALSSDVFLEEYTDAFPMHDSPFPGVLLRMRPDAEARCPFVTERGCSIYEDRPVACRLYPVGTATLFLPSDGGRRDRFFLVREPHCKGFFEKDSWDVGTWMDHEGLPEYQNANEGWMQIVLGGNLVGAKEWSTQKQQMFYMTSYNQDRFRAFLLGTRFFERFVVATEEKTAILSDDIALLRLGCKWLRFSLFGEATLMTA